MKEVFNSLSRVFSAASKLFEKVAVLAAEIEPEMTEVKTSVKDFATVVHHETKTAVEDYKRIAEETTSEDSEEAPEEPDPAEVMIHGECVSVARFLYQYAIDWKDIYASVERDTRFYSEEFQFVNRDLSTEGPLGDVLDKVKYVWLVKGNRGILLPVLDNINTLLRYEVVCYIDKSPINAVYIFLD